MVNGKRKGKVGELELSHKLNEYGYNTRRTNQYCGKTEESSDLVGLDYIHIECKRVQALNIDEAMEQAKRDAKEKLPAVFHRKNNKKWKVTMYLDDWIKLYNEYYSSIKLKEKD